MGVNAKGCCGRRNESMKQAHDADANRSGGKSLLGSVQSQPSVLLPPRPHMTWGGVLIAAALWIVYSFVAAIPLKYNAGIPFSWALTGTLCNNAFMALLSIPAWLIVIRWMDSYSWPWKIAAHLMIGPLYAMVDYQFNVQLIVWFSGGGAALRPVTSAFGWMLTWNFLLYVLQFAIYHGVVTLTRLRLKERQTLELLSLSKEMELAALKSQINPHFFFNILNSISAMASHDAEEARIMIAQLGDLLRYATDMSRNDFVPLRDEVAFVKSYLALESKRLCDRLQVELNVADRALDILVPPMILQPLVENAIKHGIEPNEDGGRIIVAVAVDAERMSVCVRDTGVGFKGTALSSVGSGIGLKNTDARLRKLFGEESGLWTDTPESGGFEVGFSLPINESAGR